MYFTLPHEAKYTLNKVVFILASEAKIPAGVVLPLGNPISLIWSRDKYDKLDYCMAEMIG